MPAPTAVFCDVGGVLLTNGWDRTARRRSVEQFKLDWEEFEDRHELVASAFEKGQLTLKAYLDRTVFYRPRQFTPEDFKSFMLAQSEAFADTLAVLERLARSKLYLLGTLNNESLELNLYRIERFGLRRYFDVFFSSCFLGVQKPDAAIYRLALQMTQRAPEEFVFVDDRPLNLECAREMGIHTIRFENASQLERDLRELGVQV
jgi:putative hydrolase of the HAD superfamily